MLESMKIKKSKPAKKLRNTLLCWITASSLLALSGCGASTDTVEDNKKEKEPETTTTAIIFNNNDAMLVDIWRVEDDEINRDASFGDYVLYTNSGDIVIISGEFVEIVKGKNSRQKAETLAQVLIGEDVNIVYYDEILNKKGLK